MTFDEVLGQIQDLLQREKRVSYRGLKQRFALDDAYLEDLKEELIGAKRLVADEDGRFLVWTGGTTVASSQLSVPSTQHPRSRSVFSQGHRHCSRATSEVAGTAGGDELEPSMAAPGQEGRSSQDVG